MSKEKELLRKKRHVRIRSRVKGSKEQPRVHVYKTHMYTYAQVINDEDNKVLFGVTDKSFKKDTKVNRAKELGKELAKKLKEAKISAICFDRGGYQYHGRIKAVAESLREEGIKF